MVETVIFAALAAFLGLRLYAVLGRRDGHEQPLVKPMEEPQATPKAILVEDGGREAVAAPPPEPAVFDSSVEAGLRAIAAADPAFNAADFVGGAKQAYRVILEAYWTGDREQLRDLCDDDVYESFVEAIDARDAAGERLDNKLISIEKTVISTAELEGRTARITVKFEADIAAVTRNSDGKVVAGSLSDAVATHDIWTFEREVRARDPNWTLTDTDEAS